MIKAGRALLRSQLQPSLFPSYYHPIMLDAARDLLLRLIDTPHNFMAHLHHMTASVILFSAYGIKVQPENDPYLDIAEKASEGVRAVGNPGTFLVEVLPIMKYIPEWCPGAGFQRKAREWRMPAEALPKITMDYVKKAMVGMVRSFDQCVYVTDTFI
jgi:hypothetical protein